MCFNIFPGPVSFRYCAPNNASQAFIMEVSNFVLFSATPFLDEVKSIFEEVIAFIECGLCISGYRDACVSEHHRPSKIDWNSSDGLSP